LSVAFCIASRRLVGWDAHLPWPTHKGWVYESPYCFICSSLSIRTFSCTLTDFSSIYTSLRLIKNAFLWLWTPDLLGPYSAEQFEPSYTCFDILTCHGIFKTFAVIVFAYRVKCTVYISRQRASNGQTAESWDCDAVVDGNKTTGLTLGSRYARQYIQTYSGAVRNHAHLLRVYITSLWVWHDILHVTTHRKNLDLYQANPVRFWPTKVGLERTDLVWPHFILTLLCTKLPKIMVM